jgi:hypothetical protein
MAAPRKPRAQARPRPITPRAVAEKQALDDALHYGGLGALPAAPTTPPPQEEEPARHKPARARRR